jgi:hypothetical protein
VVQKGKSLDYIIHILDRTREMFSSNILGIPGSFLSSLSDFSGLIVQLVLVLLIIVLGQYAIEYSYRVRILYYSLLTGITSAGFYQAMMNIYGIQNNDLVQSSTYGIIGSVMLMVLCMSGGIIAIYQPWNKVRMFNLKDRIDSLKDKPYRAALLLIIVGLAFSLFTFIGSLALPVKGSTAGSDAVNNVLNAVASLFHPGSAQPSTGQIRSLPAVDPLFVLIAGAVAIIALGAAASFFFIVELSALNYINRFLEGLKLGLARLRKTKRELPAPEPLPAKPVVAPVRPDYKDDIRHLRDISDAVGFYDVQYIDMANNLSNKHGVDTSQILYDQWALVKEEA